MEAGALLLREIDVTANISHLRQRLHIAAEPGTSSWRSPGASCYRIARLDSSVLIKGPQYKPIHALFQDINLAKSHVICNRIDNSTSKNNRAG
jgi:hypothetical protein